MDWILSDGYSPSCRGVAPTRGATKVEYQQEEESEVSIHAPTRGATPNAALAISAVRIELDYSL
jgi:hypothetical protein